MVQPGQQQHTLIQPQAGAGLLLQPQAMFPMQGGQGRGRQRSSLPPAPSRTPAYPGASCLPAALGLGGGGGGGGARQRDPATPAQVPVVCNGNRGVFIVESQCMACQCSHCSERAAKLKLPYLELTPTEFERHSGARRGLGGRVLPSLLRPRSLRHPAVQSSSLTPASFFSAPCPLLPAPCRAPQAWLPARSGSTRCASSPAAPPAPSATGSTSTASSPSTRGGCWAVL